MLPRQAEEHKGTHPPLHHSEEASQRIPSPWLDRRGINAVGAFPKYPLDLHNQTDHPLYVLYLQRVDRHAQGPQIHYCIHVRVTLGEGGNQPSPSHVWSGSLIADIFQDDLEEWITKALILAPGEAILFFGRQSCKEGLPFGNARDIRFSLTGSVNWARRLAQVGATVSTFQEDHWAIMDAVMEK